MPKAHRVTIGLTVLNLALFILMFSQSATVLHGQSTADVLRGRGLEILDDQGRIRAQILVHGPETVNGIRYPGAVLLRLSDPVGGPVVKLTAAANGAALGLSDGRTGTGGIQLYARDTASFVRVVSKSGRTQVLKP